MKLEIGAGDIGKEGFIHTELNLPVMKNHIEVICDGQYLPFKDNVFEEIFMWGVVEHFTYQGVKKLFVECRRVLSTYGTIEFCVPDLKTVCNIILTDKTPFGEPPFGSDYNRCENKIMGYALGCLYGSQNGPGQVHQSGWTIEIIEQYLKDAKFSIIKFDRNAYEPNTHLHFLAKK